VKEAKDFIFSAQNAASKTWKVELRDRSVADYTYSVTFFMTDGTRKSVGPTTTGELTLILDPFQ
jgi:hypothetical protein